MPKSAFADKDRPPTMEDVLGVIGTKRPLFESVVEFVEGTYGVSGFLKYYGKNYGWMVQYRRAGRTLVSLYPREEAVTVQVVLGPRHVREALAMKLGKNVRTALQEARDYPEGRWLFIDLETERDVRDVRGLLLLKSPPPAKRGAPRKTASS